MSDPKPNGEKKGEPKEVREMKQCLDEYSRDVRQKLSEKRRQLRSSRPQPMPETAPAEDEPVTVKP